MDSQRSLEVADILRRFGDDYRRSRGPLAGFQERVIRSITQCRTPTLGGHLYACEDCGVTQTHYNSCCDRHCPKCQGLARWRWLEKRKEEILPVPYFHIVFTVPASLKPLFLRAPRRMFNLLFRAVADTLLEVAADPQHLGARIGFLAVLHTWGQQLQLHPHLHVICPGGGLSPDGRTWIASDPEFFLPVRVLAKVFRNKLLDAVERAAQKGEPIFPDDLDPCAAVQCYRAWLEGLRSRPWVVYSKAPAQGVERVLEYLARYTHRVAISNQRLLRIEGDRVVFRYKNYRADGQVKETDLEGVEFIRRFLLHILPQGFQRIRSYGLLANRHRSKNLETCRKLLGVASPSDEEVEREDAKEPAWRPLCKVCDEGLLVVIETLPAVPKDRRYLGGRAPP